MGGGGGGGGQRLLGVVLLALMVGGMAVIAGHAGPGLSIQVKHERTGVFLHCKVGSESFGGWSKDGHSISQANQSRLFVGSAADDPRGLYRCHTRDETASLQLHFRMCQYCVQLDLATMLGIVAAQVVATTFLVGAVWCLAAQEPAQRSRASDKQTLLAHDQLYQPLGERNNGQYSHIGVAKARRR